MANRKAIFKSNKGKKEDQWNTNTVGPWRKVYTYRKSDGSKWRVDTRWIGIDQKRGKRYDWRSGSEERQVMIEPPTDKGA